jgi:hypothetical protein
MSYDFDYFSGRHLKYPAKPTKPTLGRNPSSTEARAFADALEEYEREFKGYEEDKRYYQSQMSALHKEFLNKLKADYAMGDEEFDAIWSEAYDRGHSGGLGEVFGEFDRLYDFVNKYTSIMMMKG